MKPIEDIKAGDLVAARNELTGETRYREVLQLIGNPEKALLTVTFSDALGVQESFEVTDDHPFMTEGGWITTANLQPGMQLKTFDGRPVTVAAKVDNGKKARTYNFEVAEFHTYFVGKSGIWVHNAGPCDALEGMGGGGGHAIRRLEGILIPKNGSLESRVEAFKKLARPILENPIGTSDWRIGAHWGRAYLGNVNGQNVVIWVAAEGPNKGKVASSLFPDPNQMKLMFNR